jgi:hypothetical protein
MPEVGASADQEEEDGQERREVEESTHDGGGVF